MTEPEASTLEAAPAEWGQDGTGEFGTGDVEKLNPAER
jgi:hypothetical protein